MSVSATGPVRESDPKPAYCSACLQGSRHDLRFWDLDAAFDAGVFVREDLTYVDGSDDLHLCDDCVRRLVEATGFKPGLHRRQHDAMRQLERERDEWRERYQKLLAAYDQLAGSLGLEEAA